MKNTPAPMTASASRDNPMPTFTSAASSVRRQYRIGRYGAGRLAVEGFAGSRCVRSLLVERLAIADAALHELRPVGNDDGRIGSFGQQRPQVWVMPAKFVACAVAMFSNALAKAFYLCQQLFVRHLLEIVVHAVILSERMCWEAQSLAMIR